MAGGSSSGYLWLSRREFGGVIRGGCGEREGRVHRAGRVE